MSADDETAHADSETSSNGRATTLGSRERRRSFRYWQWRILLSALVGYALFYFVRKNLSAAAPAMYGKLGFTKEQFGLFLTLHGVLYGVSKFVNGVLGDRLNARWFMPFGLVCCAVLNIAFGFSTSMVALGVLWTLNGWFQGIGFPPCARLMTHWFSPREFATKMAIWNSSHSIGAGLVFILCALLAPYDWRLCFFVPAGIVLCGAVCLVFTLRDTPESLGFPPVEGTADHSQDEEQFSGAVMRLVFRNPYIWLLSIANFFVYAVRYGILDWAPTFLKEARGIKLADANYITAAYEAAGLLGMIYGGWITDRLFGGRAARASFFYMIGCTVSLLLFWKLPNQTWVSSTILLCLVGFSIYGPQSLIGTATAKLATKRAAATAIGLNSIFGYASTTLSGWGIGRIAQQNGWDAGFLVFVVCSAMGVLLFAVCWGAKAHGYAEVEDANA
ncbi:MAG: MFS transporter [Pirellulales bacterium]